MDDRWVTHEPEVHLILCSIQLLTSVDIGSIGLEDDKIVHATPAGQAAAAEEAKPKKTHRRNRSLTALLPTLKAKPKRSTDDVHALPMSLDTLISNSKP